MHHTTVIITSCGWSQFRFTRQPTHAKLFASMAEPIHRFQDICGYLLLRFIDLWLYVCGRKRRRADVPWLISPAGPKDIIGEHWYEQLAEREGLKITTAPNAGLMPNFGDLRGPSFDPDKVCAEVRDFYEHTARYSL